MNPIKNPFSPGAGSPPPELVGREEILSQSNILLHRILQKRTEKSFLLTGLRGVGKTVLLNEIDRQAEAIGYKTILVEAHESKSLGALVIPPIRSLLFGLDRLAGAGDKVRRGLAVLKSFINTIKIKVGDVEFGLGIDPELGTADTGDIEIDLPNLFVALAEAAEERNTAVAILIDEIQYFSINEISALIMAMHKMQQKRLPLILIGAGLPILPALAGDSKSYAERLFQFPNIGPLTAADANKALQDPVKDVNVEFTQEALMEIYKLTKGYPYFLQEWGYQCWNYAKDSPIDLQDVKEATALVIRGLDENFFRVRFDRLTPSEQNYLRGMAELGNGPKKTGDIAEVLGKNVSSLGPVRDKLIKKGMIYSPSHGEMAFTVPLFDEYMKRVIPNFKIFE